ncbi:hypothetical protein MMC09_004922 [Bachmanniomyces sp. S44760]|nr:hypothetical protein [Bachmanniomyces sp. S44760]
MPIIERKRKDKMSLSTPHQATMKPSLLLFPQFQPATTGNYPNMQNNKAMIFISVWTNARKFEDGQDPEMAKLETFTR